MLNANTNANSRTTKTYFIILADYLNHKKTNQAILTEYQLVKDLLHIQTYQQKMVGLTLALLNNVIVIRPCHIGKDAN